MNIRSTILIASTLFALAACGSENTHDNQTAERPAYATLDTNLTQLRQAFNAASDKYRLLFISGPSCGICLRGMDDLNKALVASLQNDSRIHTFVVHVPTLGAEEHHAAASIALMPGPRVSHYWDPEGTTGIEFQQALDIDIYAWDVWLVYEPGVRWEETAPSPVFWQHQLPPLPKATKLDAEEFAAFVNGRLETLPYEAGNTAEIVASDDVASEMFNVAQPLAVMIKANHQSRGGYKTLKSIVELSYEGITETEGSQYAVKIRTSRPGTYERTIMTDEGPAVIRFDGSELLRGDNTTTVLPEVISNVWLTSFEFDGWMTDWKAKGHEVRRLGMKKRDGRLPWLVLAELANGQRWHIYVDSHSGDAYRQALIDSQGNETIALEFDDYRDTEGFRFPHEVRYYEMDRLLAIDRYDEITVMISTAGSD